MIDKTIIYLGSRFDIYAITVQGECPVKKFIDNLEHKDQVKIIQLLKVTADNGTRSNPEKFKKLEKDIWEFKSHQVRLPCFFEKDKIIVITHGFKKTTNKIPKTQMERAIKLRNDYLSERKTK